MPGLLIFLALIAVLVVYPVILYNGLVGLRNQVRNAWSQIDVQLKRRHDLIPNLVETAKGYMTHERETLDSVTQARSRAVNASTVGEKARAEGELSGFMSRFFALAENYPDLKANQNFLALQEELTATENRIAFSRQAYNDATMSFNNKTQMLPSSLIADWLHFQPFEFFEIGEAAERAVPKVNFS